MKKLLLFMFALLTGVSGAWADEVTLGSQVTDLGTLSSSKSYVLKNVGSSRYNYYDVTNLQMDAKEAVDYSCVVKLNYDGENVTIQQASTGTYYQGLVDNTRLTLGESPVNFTFNIDGVNAGEFRFANNSLYLNRYGSSTQYPIGAATSFAGAYSRWNIYEVTVNESYTVQYYSKDLGTYNSTGNFASKWTHTATGLVLSTTANNIQTSTGYIFSGSSGCTYTLRAPNGFLIAGYTISGTAQTAAQTLTPEGKSGTEFGTSGTTTMAVTDLSAATASFVQSSPNNGIAISTFAIVLKADPDYVDWTPNINPESYVSVGEKVASFTAAINKDDNDHWYILTQVRGGESPMYNVGTGVNLKRTATTITPSTINGTIVTSDYQYLIRFIATETDGVYKIQFANGDFISSSLTTSLYQRDAGNYAFYNCNGGSGSYFAWNLNSKSGSIVDNNGAGSNLSLWGSGEVTGTSGNNVWYLYPVELSVPSYLIQYSISFGGNNVFTSEPVAANNGDVITELPSAYQRSFCNYNVTETTVTTPGVTTVPVTMTWNGPFTISSNFASASWYLLRMQNGGKNMKYQDGSAAYPLEDVANYDIDAEDYYSWAFTGDPYNGFTILNKQAGETKKLYKGASVGNGGIPTMSAENESTWNITRGTADSNFGISPVGHNFYLNAWSGGTTVRYWQDGPSDSGSRFTVLPVEDIDFTSMVTSYIQPYIDNPSNAYFAVTSANVSTLVDEHADGGSKTSWTKSEYQAYYNALQNAITKPVAGYYVLKNVNSNNYLTYNGPATADGANNTATAIIKLGVSGSGYTLQMQGGYLKVPSYQEHLTTQANPSVFYATIANNTPGQVKVGTDDGAHSYINYTGGVVQGFQPTTNTGWWILEDAPASITIPLNYDGSAYSYGTMYLPFGVTLTGAKAYILTVDGEWAKATEIADVPANTGVLIRATGEATSVTATINDAATAETSGNDLVGTFVDITSDRVDDSGEYILGQVDGYVGFYQRADGKKIGANKAYLNLGADLSSGGVKGILWDFVDGVKTIDNGQLTIDNDKVIYNLAGQRINKLQRGVNIVNGKKVLVK